MFSFLAKNICLPGKSIFFLYAPKEFIFWFHLADHYLLYFSGTIFRATSSSCTSLVRFVIYGLSPVIFFGKKKMPILLLTSGTQSRKILRSWFTRVLSKTGKLVEEEEGNFALWFSYIVTGAGANLVSWLLLPRNSVSVGASGAVFGLFAISVLVKVLTLKLSWRIWWHLDQKGMFPLKF